MKQRYTIILLFLLFQWPGILSIKAQISFADSCLLSSATGTSFFNSSDLTNNNADLMTWNTNTQSWDGSWSSANLTMPPPDSLAGCRAIFVGNGLTWTSGGEGFGILMNQPLVSGQSYSFSVTYVSNGSGSTGSFSPLVYTSSSTGVPSGTYIGSLPPAGYTWLTSIFSFTAGPAQSGDTWLMFFTGPTGTSGIINSFCPSCQSNSNVCNLHVNLGSDTALCNSGQLVLNATNTGADHYLWSTGDTTPVITVVDTGRYWLNAAKGTCTATDTLFVHHRSFSAKAATGAACTPASASAMVNVTTGTGPYSYNWSNAANTDTINNLTAGTYFVTVHDGGGCSLTDSVLVQPKLVEIIATTGNTCGAPSQSASVAVLTGITPYTYLWSNAATTSSISNLTAGTYYVTVSDGQGCHATDSIAVQPKTLTLAITSNGNCGTAVASASVSIVTGTGPYTYLWSNNALTDTIKNLAPGTYSVTVIDAAGCRTSDTTTINPGGNVNVTIAANKTIMCSGDSAQICTTAPFASYSWNNGDTTQCIYTSYIGTYNVVVSDNNHCTGTSNTIALAAYTPSPVTVSANGDTLTCFNGIAYQWYYNGHALSGDTTPVLLATQTGNYNVTIKDTNGCYYTSTQLYVTGINNLSLRDNFKVYPNPLQTGAWQISISENFMGTDCELFDAEGRIVYRATLKNRQTELAPDIARGVYVLRVFHNGVIFNMKLIRL